MNWLIERLNAESRLRGNAFLYIHTIIATPMTFLNVVPIPQTHLASLLMFAYLCTVCISTVFALFILANGFTSVLRDHGGLRRPHQRVPRIFVSIMLVLFFVWTNNFFNFATSIISPHMLQSQSSAYTTHDLLTEISYGTSGFIEETWRWSLISSLFYVGVRIFGIQRSKFVLWAAIFVSCVMFGLGHIGEFTGYVYGTWLVMSIMGLFLFLCAYWNRSFWMAVFIHSTYDLLASWNKFMLWWFLMIIPLYAFAYWYWRWRKTSASESFTEEAI